MRRFFILLALSFFAFPAAVPAGSCGLSAGDPMVRISGAPLTGKDVDRTLAKISLDVCRDMGLSQDLVTFTWEDIHFMNWNGRKTTDPVFVDLYVPGFFTREQIATAMESIASALEKHAGVEKKWVFIQTFVAGQGEVFLNGEVMKWDAAGPVSLEK